MNNIISNKLDTKIKNKKYKLLNINSNKPNKLKTLITKENNNDNLTLDYKVVKIQKFIDNISNFIDFLSNKERIRIIIENININFNYNNNIILLNYKIFYKVIIGIVKLINIECINSTCFKNNNLYINIDSINNNDNNDTDNDNNDMDNDNNDMDNDNNEINNDINNDMYIIITNTPNFNKYVNNNSISWNNIYSYNRYNKEISSLITVIQNYSNIIHTKIKYYTNSTITNDNGKMVMAFLIKIHNNTIYNNISLYNNKYILSNNSQHDLTNNTDLITTTLSY
jgi:hypothetical protein